MQCEWTKKRTKKSETRCPRVLKALQFLVPAVCLPVLLVSLVFAVTRFCNQDAIPKDTGYSFFLSSYSSGFCECVSRGLRGSDSHTEYLS